jgi:hypothetical protein
MTRKWLCLVLAFGLMGVLAFVYARTHPLVFMDTHRYCIKAAAMELEEYASEHDGRYPFHPGGYGNAVLLMSDDSLNAFTGPGYDPMVLREAKRTGKNLSEEECGRVYIQGLTRKSTREIALLFDKLPTPGGDHCSLPFRLLASRGREVLFIHAGHSFVPESEWPEFARKQVELLVQEGMDRKEVERLYASKPR